MSRTSRVPLETGLWLDNPHARDEIRRRQRAGELSSELGPDLELFVERGYVLLDWSRDTAFLALADRLVSEVEELWQRRPADVAFALDSPATSFALASPAQRRPSYRLHDLHSHSEAARELYLHAELFRVVERLFDGPAMAIQSLYFEWGSQQTLHRDPIVVPTLEPGRLLAAWIALEDVHPDSGPLSYVPGSHRYPYFEFAPGRFVFDANADRDDALIAAAWQHDETQCARLGLKRATFLAKKGQVFVWHASLRHGGEPLLDPARTRKSFVVHYTPRHPDVHRGMTMELPQGRRVFDTARLVESGGRAGLESPVQGLTLES